MQKMPRSRRSGLILKQVDGELLIYDLERNKAHCLNETAAKVWSYCNGEMTVEAACTSLSREFDSPFDEKLVWHALDQLAKINLLEDNVVLPEFFSGWIGRRQMLRTLGVTAVIAVPLVTTILAPVPAHAATLLPPGSPCTSSSQCTSGLCACSTPGPGCATTCQ